MHRKPLLNLLARYNATEQLDDRARDRIAAFVEANADCFERSLLQGHVTGSAWIVDPSRSQCLLTHHRKLERWLQLGGHADGQADILEVAMREAREESGLASLVPVATEIFDCDVHSIPARKTEPQHWHYDVRFLLEADPDEALVISEESKELAWVPLAGVEALSGDASVVRMVAKTAMFSTARS